MLAFFHAPHAVKILLGMGLLLSTSPTWAQPRGIQEGEVVEEAPAVAPHIYKAIAAKQDGQVVVRIWARETRLTTRDPNQPDAKGWIVTWTEMDPLVFDKQIRAYKPSGERLSEAELLKALAKQVAVVCFQRTHKSDPERPDPFFTGVLRDDVVVLVFEAKYWLRE